MKKLVLIPLVLLSLGACASTTSSSTAATVTTSSSAEVVNYTIHKGLVYGSASTKELGDIYEPNALTSNTLGIVLIHGGAFAMGNETMFASTAKWLANHGAVVYCVDYRLLAEKKFRG
jgi:acetyl esterase/lipase